LGLGGLNACARLSVALFALGLERGGRFSTNEAGGLSANGATHTSPGQRPGYAGIQI
jgi:hypothetical protein